MGYQHNTPSSALDVRISAYYSRRTWIYRLPFLRLPPLMVAPASLTKFLSVPDSFSSRTRSAVDTSITTPWTSRIGNEGDPVRRWRIGSRVSTSTRSLISMTMGVGRRLKESIRARSSRVTAEGYPIAKKKTSISLFFGREPTERGEYLCIHDDGVILPCRRD